MDGFTVIAEPTRRAIVDRLRAGEHDVGTLVDELGISQSLASKHLRVLREAGVVEAEIAGKRRLYRLTARPLPEVVAWVRPYVERWATSFDQLGRALDEDALDEDALDGEALDGEATRHGQ
ncbi:ArsR/SmtB family transcription factor [Salana multivorans]